MTDLWQPQFDQDYYYESTSDLSLLTPLGQNVVPVGTVASRILQLQNLAKYPTSNRSRSPVIRHRDNSRTGWGRRIRPRQPASRPSKPDEEVQEPKHSFLGLNTQRINHMEEHALVDGRTKWDRTTGLNAQLQPRGLGARVQYEATSPWGFLPKSISFRNLRQDHNHCGQDSHIQGKSSNKHKGKMSISLNSSSSEHDGMRRTNILPEKRAVRTLEESKRLPASRQQNKTSPPAWTAIETTSTIRQSVKDLYYHYGIQRPAGLVSSENDAEDTRRSLVQQRYCHMCSHVNSRGTIKCRCGHTLCEQCDILSPDVIITSDGSAECTENMPDSKGRDLPGNTPIGQSSNSELPKQAYRQQQNPKYKVKQQLSQEEPRQTEEAGAQNNVRISSYHIVDPLASNYWLGRLPLALWVSPSHGQHRYHGHHRRWKSRYHNGSRSGSSSESIGGTRDCDRSECHSTNQDYMPHRDSMSSIRKKRRYHEETDSGYIAGTSHLDDLDISQQKDILNSRLANQEEIHHTHSEEHLSLRNGTCNFLQSKVSCYGVGQTADQNFDQECIVSLQCEIKDQDEVKHTSNHKQLHPRLREDHATTINTSFLEGAYSYDQLRENNNRFESMPTSPGLTQDAFSELLPPDSAWQTVTTVVAPKSETNLQSLDWLNVDTAISSRNMPMQETSMNPKSECRSESFNVPSGVSKQDTLLQAFSRYTKIAHRTSSQADLCAEMLSSASIQPSGDLSPRKFKPASRRLSAFFKLQEQNIVSLLNKRLEEYQEELKRIEKRYDGQASAAAERPSLDQGQGHEMDRVGKEIQRFDEIEPARNTEHDLAASIMQTMQLNEEVSKRLATSRRDRSQDLPSPLVHRNMMEEEQEMEHDCVWKRTAMKNATERAQDPNRSGTQETTKAGKQGAGHVGINGITVVIHLEGREDVVMRADLSQGLRG